MLVRLASFLLVATFRFTLCTRISTCWCLWLLNRLPCQDLGLAHARKRNGIEMEILYMEMFQKCGSCPVPPCSQYFAIKFPWADQERTRTCHAQKPCFRARLHHQLFQALWSQTSPLWQNAAANAPCFASRCKVCPWAGCWSCCSRSVHISCKQTYCMLWLF